MRIKLCIGILLAGLAAGGPGRAQTASDAPGLLNLHLPQLTDALRHLNMTTNDCSFKKDVAEPRFCLQSVRRLLSAPLELPAFAAGIDTAGAPDGPMCLLLEHCAELLELPPLPAGPPDQRGTTRASAAHALPSQAAPFSPAGEGLARVRRTAAGCAILQDWLKAHAVYTNLPAMTASYLGSAFALEEQPGRAQALLAAGVPEEAIARAMRDALTVNPEPAAMRTLNVVTNFPLARLIAAASELHTLAGELASLAASVTNWPSQIVRFDSPAGPVFVGTTGNDRYDEAAFLILDPAGDDIYEGPAGAANGLQGRTVAMVIDLGGNDRYRATGLLAPGSALGGIALLLDAAGDDVHEAEYLGCAAAVCGVAVQEDRAGNDIYRAHGPAQGAAFCGVGILRDRQGRDLYDTGFYGQGFAGVRAVGLLLDEAGNDRYIAGGRKPDFDRNAHRFLSLSQGFSIGMRPFAGGGVAALIDRAGNDSYEADVYGQGVSYWYSIGILLDAEGEDTYRIHQYGQGSGIHLSLGLLADASGHDTYTGRVLAQGNAHDYAVGMLLDQAGNDMYSADHFSQGRAMNNSFALLLDADGRDAYFAAQTDRCQGIGDDGHYREYGSLALLLDLGGMDTYSCGALNGARLLRPDVGIVYDALPEEAAP